MAYHYETLLCEQHESVMLITINRPAVLNALNGTVFSELGKVFMAMRQDKSIKAVVLTGAGEKSFVAGADIGQMASYTTMQARELCNQAKLSQQAVATFPKPVIAAVNGFCFGGGCELAMCCDIIIASEKAQFGLPEINLGIIPGGGGTQRLQRLVGPQIAKLMIFTGKTIRANEAVSIGLAAQTVPHEQVVAEAIAMGKTIAQKSGFAVEVAKTAVNVGGQLDLESGLQLEIEVFSQCFSGPDQKEGMQAFIEKRKAKFVL